MALDLPVGLQVTHRRSCFRPRGSRAPPSPPRSSPTAGRGTGTFHHVTLVHQPAWRGCPSGGNPLTASVAPPGFGGLGQGAVSCLSLRGARRMTAAGGCNYGRREMASEGPERRGCHTPDGFTESRDAAGRACSPAPAFQPGSRPAHAPRPRPLQLSETGDLEGGGRPRRHRTAPGTLGWHVLAARLRGGREGRPRCPRRAFRPLPVQLLGGRTQEASLSEGSAAATVGAALLRGPQGRPLQSAVGTRGGRPAPVKRL